MVRIFFVHVVHKSVKAAPYRITQLLRTFSCSLWRLKHLSGFPGWLWLLLLAGNVMLVAGCKGDNIISSIGKEKFSFSVLTINLQGIYEQYGNNTINWEARYSRIANWMATTKTLPDFIALQEVHGLSGDVKSYSTLFTLISRIKEQTNLTYRIAYLTVRPVPQGLRPTLWAGNALLYNPERINNRSFGASSSIPSPYNDETAIGVHPRMSLPCTDPLESFKDLCTLIDEDGVSWICSYRGVDSRWYFGPVFGR